MDRARHSRDIGAADRVSSFFANEWRERAHAGTDQAAVGYEKTERAQALETGESAWHKSC
jgi:hypothetical protein